MLSRWIHRPVLRSLATTARPLRKKTKRGTRDKTSRENILHREIHDIIAQKGISIDDIKIPQDLLHRFLYAKDTENSFVENVEVVGQTSEGEGLAIVPRSAYDATSSDAFTVAIIPKTVPGDLVSIRLRRHMDYAAEAELVAVTGRAGKRNKRNDRLVVCPHFSTCSGCQFQMMKYEHQLEFKQSVIQKAYRYFFPAALPMLSDFGPVIGSPMEYSYRTKLTPHANVPNTITESSLPFPVGFKDVRPLRPNVDVDWCPIAMNSINEGLQKNRKKFAEESAEVALGIRKKVSGQFLLRDSFRVDHATGAFENVCIDDPKKVVTEKVGDYVFQFPANEFFQGNRAILPTLLDFIKHQLHDIPYKNLVDVYCGSGFLGIGLSDTIPEDGKLLGIEISAASIKYATHNSKLNGLNNASYVESNSDQLFSTKEFMDLQVDGDSSVVLMNPSRKGSSVEFMKQLLSYKPKAIVYVSCNPFTQARDLADFHNLQCQTGTNYRIKTVTGFDFYPQTKHVESVAVLELE